MNNLREYYKKNICSECKIRDTCNKNLIKIQDKINKIKIIKCDNYRQDENIQHNYQLEIIRYSHREYNKKFKEL